MTKSKGKKKKKRPTGSDGGPEKERLDEKDLVERLDELTVKTEAKDVTDIQYIGYKDESQLEEIMRLMEKFLSEPYTIFTYRFFLHNWPNLCFLATKEDKIIGSVIGKAEMSKENRFTGYIAMLAVDNGYRNRGIGSTLVRQIIKAMIAMNCEDVMLETEVTNVGALKLYDKLGFIREERLLKYYLNGVDAFRLKLWLE